MELIALLAALLLERFCRRRPDQWLNRVGRRLVDLTWRDTQTGRVAPLVLAGAGLLAGSVLVVLVLQFAAARVAAPALFALHLAILWLTVRFHSTTRPLRAILLALEAEDSERAEGLLREWRARGSGASEARGAAGIEIARGRVGLCRGAIMKALADLYREFFGPVLAYLLLPGAIGPVAWWVLDGLAQRWIELDAMQGDTDVDAASSPGPVLADGEAAASASVRDMRAGRAPGPHGLMALRVRRIIDWIPLRVMAAGCAIAGNFEDTIYCWRAAIAARAGGDRHRMLAAFGSGALGTDLYDRAPPGGHAEQGADASSVVEIGATPPDSAAVRSTVGLMWRAVTLLLGLFVLVALSSWLGAINLDRTVP